MRAGELARPLLSTFYWSVTLLDETGNGHLCAANVNRSGANAPVCGFRETPTMEEKNVLFARN